MLLPPAGSSEPVVPIVLRVLGLVPDQELEVLAPPSLAIQVPGQAAADQGERLAWRGWGGW